MYKNALTVAKRVRAAFDDKMPLGLTREEKDIKFKRVYIRMHPNTPAPVLTAAMNAVAQTIRMQGSAFWTERTRDVSPPRPVPVPREPTLDIKTGALALLVQLEAIHTVYGENVTLFREKIDELLTPALQENVLYVNGEQQHVLKSLLLEIANLDDTKPNKQDLINALIYWCITTYIPEIDFSPSAITFKTKYGKWAPPFFTQLSELTDFNSTVSTWLKQRFAALHSDWIGMITERLLEETSRFTTNVDKIVVIVAEAPAPTPVPALPVPEPTPPVLIPEPTESLSPELEKMQADAHALLSQLDTLYGIVGKNKATFRKKIDELLKPTTREIAPYIKGESYHVLGYLLAAIDEFPSTDKARKASLAYGVLYWALDTCVPEIEVVFSDADFAKVVKGYDTVVKQGETGTSGRRYVLKTRREVWAPLFFKMLTNPLAVYSKWIKQRVSGIDDTWAIRIAEQLMATTRNFTSLRDVIVTVE